jgi:hypothetical protein
MDELFDTLTRIVAHPHTAITDHDRIRAARAMLALGDYGEIGKFCEYASLTIDTLEKRQP